MSIITEPGGKGRWVVGCDAVLSSFVRWAVRSKTSPSDCARLNTEGKVLGSPECGEDVPERGEDRGEELEGVTVQLEAPQPELSLMGKETRGTPMRVGVG